LERLEPTLLDVAIFVLFYTIFAAASLFLIKSVRKLVPVSVPIPVPKMGSVIIDSIVEINFVFVRSKIEFIMEE
jgi:hypothetical protein